MAKSTSQPPPGPNHSPRVHPLTRVLRAQWFGLLCAALGVISLATGSFIMDRHPDAYQGLQMDDMRFFFTPIRAIHGWFYAAGLIFGLWALSTLVCTWEELRVRFRRGIRRPSAYGVPLIHLGFVLALSSHLIGGLWSHSQMHVIHRGWTPIGTWEYRLLNIQPELYPSGMPRQITAHLERRDGSGTTEATQIAFNQPIVQGWGASALLMGRSGQMPLCTFRLGDTLLQIAPNVVWELPDGRDIELLAIDAPNGVPVATVQIDGAPTRLRLQPRAAGAALAFTDIEVSPALALTERQNPSMPLTIVLSGLLVLGVLLLLWERRHRRHAHR